MHRRGTSTNNTDTLIGDVDIVIPARGMEGVAFKRFHAIDLRQLRRGQNTIGDHQIFGFHIVTAISADLPAARSLVPLGFFNRRVEQAFIVEPRLFRDVLTVFHNLETTGEFHRGDITHLFQQRQVAVRLYIASNARVTVPVPGATDVAAFFTETYIFVTGLTQLVPQQKTGETSTNDKNFTLII